MTNRLIVSVAFAAAIVAGSIDGAQAQIADAKCADKANNFARKVSAAQNKEVRGCIKEEGKGTLQTTVEACLIADADQKVQGKEDKVTGLFAAGGACEGDEGTDLVTDAATINAAHVAEPIALAHHIFGADLDSGQISTETAARKCQGGIVKRAGQMYDAWVKEFRKCKKAAMKNGATTEAEIVSACLSGAAVRGTGSGLEDAKGKVAGKGEKLAGDVQGHCVDESLDLEALAPGACAGGGVQGDFAKCVQDLVECHACETVRVGDGLDVDCDTIDDDVIGTCPPQVIDGACEILNATECLLPYPSSRFLVADPSTDTGVRVDLPAAGMPPVNGTPFSPAAYNELDGFSPMVQIMMNFPQGVDLALSDTGRLLAPECCGQPAGPPWIDTRTYTGRSLDADSPSVLLKASDGSRVLHWLELDGRTNNPARQTLFLRPGVSLEPGERYIVAIRNLKTPTGADVLPEGPFAALRDNTPTDIQAIEDRRAQMESDVFAPLTGFGIDRDSLVLAFDFVVQSDDQLTRQMVSMRDQAFDWLDTVDMTPGLVTFTVSATTPISNCTDPGDVEWKRISGVYQSPLFLTGQPTQGSLQFLNVDANDVPVQNGFMSAPFDISIPCSVFAVGVTSRPIYLGHGIFGTGLGMVQSIPSSKARFADWTYIAGGTDWIGLSSRRDTSGDDGWILSNIIGTGLSQLNNLPAFIDRLRQGMLNALVLSKMMKLGLFNRHLAFEISPGVGAFPGPTEEMYYYGISLGGIYGTMMAALSPDMDRYGLDVGGANFACLLQRSTQFAPFEFVIQAVGLTDPMHFALFVDLLGELWVSGEPAGYLRHITSDMLPGSGNPKHMYYTPSWLDLQVSNQCTEAAVRTMGLTNLPGSIQQSLEGITDAPGPVDNGVILYDGGAYDILNPAHQLEFPALSNTIASSASCDPHNDPRNIPAAVRSLIAFLQPGGQIANFCNGVCDSGEPLEIKNGGTCDSLSPPLLQNQPCALNSECGGGTCVAAPICDPLD